jgi:hypothetical protein
MDKENQINILEYVNQKINMTLENDKRIVEILMEANHDMVELNQKLDKILEKYNEEREIIDECPICHETVYDDEDYIVDDSNTYDGICHEDCYYEAEESRLG